jgi:hypothetical protein bcoam_14499
MKELNKKGFTLVELLVVIVILGVIMSIAIPSITSSIERSKDKQKTQIIKLIESAGELYVDKHKNTVTPPITLNQLIEDGLITKEEMKDPFNEKRTLCGYLGYDGKKVSWNDTSGNNQYCLSIE